jgi:hypothetical protein
MQRNDNQVILVQSSTQQKHQHQEANEQGRTFKLFVAIPRSLAELLARLLSGESEAEAQLR